MIVVEIENKHDRELLVDLMPQGLGVMFASLPNLCQVPVARMY
jgi:hypothetical protein